MKAAAATVLLVVCALGASACSGRQAASNQPGTVTSVLPLILKSFDAPVPASLRSLVRSTIKSGTPDGKIDEIDVYGPGSRTALVKASSGDIVNESPNEETMRFYLIVLRGNFVCDGCSGPPGSKPPHGTIETRVWSPQEGGTDFGISDSLPGGMSSLHRLATIKLH